MGEGSVTGIDVTNVEVIDGHELAFDKRGHLKRHYVTKLFRQGLRLCRKCQRIKPLEEFYNSANDRIGKHTRCKDCMNANAADWHKRKPWINRVSSLNQRARSLGLPNRIKREELEDLYYNSEQVCAYCGGSIQSDWVIDHIVPLSKGGSNQLSNLAIVCPSCNKSKADMTVNEWLEHCSRVLEYSKAS